MIYDNDTAGKGGWRGGTVGIVGGGWMLMGSGQEYDPSSVEDAH
jgi:hypothetical protein